MNSYERTSTGTARSTHVLGGDTRNRKKYEVHSLRQCGPAGSLESRVLICHNRSTTYAVQIPTLDSERPWRAPPPAAWGLNISTTIGTRSQHPLKRNSVSSYLRVEGFLYGAYFACV